MQVTIIAGGTLAVDGLALAVDTSSLPPEFHALQWDGTRGEVEYSVTRCDHCGARTKKGNEIISDLAPYQKYVDAWHVAKAEADAAAKVAAEEAAKAKAALELVHTEAAAQAAAPAVVPPATLAEPAPAPAETGVANATR